MHTITRRLEFDAGHRVLGHEGKCCHLHGHRYVAEISVQSAKLDRLGMVVDFSLIKTLVGRWIDEYWDHNFLVHKDDPLLLCIERGDSTGKVTMGKQPYIMKDGNPTAENMAQVLFDKADFLLRTEGIKVVEVRLYETPNCWAVVRSPS